MKKFYFDYAAATPVDKRAVKAMNLYYSGIFGNPSSIHKFGQEASAAVFKARNKIAKLIGCDYREIIFTGSATEANNLAIRGVVKRFWQFSDGIAIQLLQRQLPVTSRSDGPAKRVPSPSEFRSFRTKTTKTFLPRIITSKIEHESVLETCHDLEKEGLAEVVYLPVSKEGIVDLKKLKTSLNERTVLVSIMYANNEIGSIQPIGEIAKIIQEFKLRNVGIVGNDKFGQAKRSNKRGFAGDQTITISLYPLLHTDAAQAFNYLDCNVADLGVDLMTLSSQKIYGPKGVGFLYVKNFGNFQGEKFINPIITGGRQEEGLRAGTENTAGIVGFAEAAELVSNSRELENKRLKKIQNYFWKRIKKYFPKVILNGPMIGKDRLPNNINIYFPPKKDLIFKLDMAGFAVSAGSACSSRMAKPSHVLKALGYSNQKADESVRISFGRQTTKQDIDKLLTAIKNSSC